MQLKLTMASATRSIRTLLTKQRKRYKKRKTLLRRNMIRQEFTIETLRRWMEGVIKVNGTVRTSVKAMEYRCTKMVQCMKVSG